MTVFFKLSTIYHSLQNCFSSNTNPLTGCPSFSGLWVSDLTITQLFLQTVEETERGIVSSMQNSMNKLMDMLKFVMVIIAPYPHQFGLLVIISYVFICLAWVLYAVYCRKVRGHFFHFEKVTRCVNNNQATQQQSNTEAVDAV